MPKIVKAEGAPEGTITVTHARGEFSVTGQGHNTTDPLEIEAGQLSPLLDVEYKDSELEPETDPRAVVAPTEPPVEQAKDVAVTESRKGGRD